MTNTRPTHAEFADAAHRMTDAIGEVYAALRKCGEILRERRPVGSSTYPLFWEGDAINNCLQKSRLALQESAYPISFQGFNAGRVVAQYDD